MEEIKPKVLGYYDKNKAGSYKLKYQAQDSSNNLTEYDFILNIITTPLTTLTIYPLLVVNVLLLGSNI